MKFSEIESSAWPGLKPYLDTALLPVTGLDGSENPVEAAEALEDLRDVLDLIEIPFKGRTVTYPAMHYIGDGDAGAASRLVIEHACERMKRAGFRYVILVTAAKREIMELGPEFPGADLIVRVTAEELGAQYEEARRAVADKLTELWLAR
ncbi:DUF2487 family protein [Paenibacillus puerhi]|uniref:DUF2487 family protein n=1 Tax=Paenibacillus puerhi TaxID=2692622 RepID=UPI0013575674|nr:DUF2487 family protein [Paenibacillus puerhi]